MVEFYRYDAQKYTLSDSPDTIFGLSIFPSIKLSVFVGVKETEKGYWIKDKGLVDMSGIKPRWISKTSRKRFAYPTKEEALNSFVIRTHRRVSILEEEFDFAKTALRLGKEMLEKQEQ
jgi:hypothetical protein